MMPGYAQDVDSEVRQRALEDFHGPDLEGKDGPLARVGFDLTLLYHEWQTYRQEAADGAFDPSASSMPVRAGYVTVDATAVQEADALQDDLEDLGLEDAARSGRVVSGYLPIAAIPDAAQLVRLQSMRPARAVTHRTPSVAPDTVAERPSEAPEQEADHTRWYVAGGAAVVAIAVAAFLLRR